VDSQPHEDILGLKILLRPADGESRWIIMDVLASYCPGHL